MKKKIQSIKDIYVNLFILKIKLFNNKLSDKKIKFLNYTIRIQDIKSFYYEIIYIFRDKIYHFETIKKNPIIIDGGSCIGTSILYFKKNYPNSKIIAFEPSPYVFEILKENISRNNLKDVQLINSGLSDINSKLTFSKNNVDSGKIEKDGEITIEVEKLSNYICEEIDFLKLNIEGAEYEVLKEIDENGKIKYIKEMCFEWHSFKNQKQNLDKILSILSKNDFKYCISSLSTSEFGEFKIEKETEYFMMIYAKKIN